MGSKRLYGWILGIIIIAALIYLWRNSVGEPFQVSNCSIADAETPAVSERFTRILASKDTDTVSQAILRVSSPDPSDPNDRLPVKFSNYISMYALARRANMTDVSGARASLFNCYNTLQTEMETKLYDTAKRGAWTASPKTETCKKLDLLRAKYIVEYAKIIKQVQDLSGTEVTAEKMRDENLKIQDRLTKACKESPMSQACKDLASQEIPVYDLLSKYENVNVSMFVNALDISDNLLTINQVYSVMDCAIPNQFFSTGVGAPLFWVDKNKKYSVTLASCMTPLDLKQKCEAPNIAPQSFFDSLETGATPFTASMATTTPMLEIKDNEIPFIDTETLRTKLQTMSPYYISPDILDAIMGSVQSDAAAKLQTTPEILANLSTVIGNIKRYTNTP